MAEEHDLRDFRNVCRLFPLPGVVLFPHAVLPLHIFEPRYRRMTEDALAGDKLVTIVQVDPGGEPVAGGPAIEEVACLGKIIKHERLADGRFNFLLLGLSRVRLTREVPSSKPYRIAEAELLADEPPERPEEPHRTELIHLFRAIAVQQKALDPDLASMLKGPLSLGLLTDIIAHALGLPAAIKQAFLTDLRVESRVQGLISILREVAERTSLPALGGEPFPPPFSIN